MAQAGVGPLLCGSMSEAHHIAADERTTLIRAARSALDAAGLTHVPLIVGTGVGSTRETIALTKAAAAAGADYSIVITSGYYAGALAKSPAALHAFFTDIADASPIPVMIYNCECAFRPSGPCRLTNLLSPRRSGRPQPRFRPHHRARKAPEHLRREADVRARLFAYPSECA
jgi:hypothetical protein